MKGCIRHMTTMRTDTFVQKLSEKGYTKKDAKIILYDVIDTFGEALVEGKDINLYGFGKFKVIEVADHNVVNPNDISQIITVPAHKKIRFFPGVPLVRAVNNGIYTRNKR